MKYFDMVRLAHQLESASRASVSLEEWSGLSVTVDPSLPEDVIELRDKDGVVVQRLHVPAPKNG